MKPLTELEIKILNRVQKDWKITKTPFAELSDELNIDESELIKTIKDLKESQIIRDISAIFNAESLGYDSALIALSVAEEKIENAASIINSHPGVSHNYLRDHTYNIWFTLAVPPETSLENEAEILAGQSKAMDFLVFKNEKLLKIGLILNLDQESDEFYSDSLKAKKRKQIKYRPLSDEEKKAVNILQTDLPLVARPFKELIEKSGLDLQEDRLLEMFNRFKEERIIRRYSAILKHTKAGFTHNAMSSWRLGDYNNDSILEVFLSSPSISHLYIRTIHPGKWEHGLFAMIHARSEDELNTIIKKLEKESGINDYLVLHSLREFKKQRVKYFYNEF